LNISGNIFLIAAGHRAIAAARNLPQLFAIHA
jgi:hypothetical protein